MLLLHEVDNDRTLDVRLGETVQVSLPENATTGYRWSIDRVDGEFKVLESEFRYTKEAIGSGGEIVFTFQGTKVGTGEIALKHWRPWEGDSSVIARFRARLNVKP